MMRFVRMMKATNAGKLARKCGGTRYGGSHCRECAQRIATSAAADTAATRENTISGSGKTMIEHAVTTVFLEYQSKREREKERKCFLCVVA